MYCIYTDGSCSPNPGKGGCATVFVKDNKNVFNIVESYDNTTNNRMELMAIINAFDYFPKSGNPIIIYTDSTYCMDGITKYINNWIKNGWKTADKNPVKNKDLWLLYLEKSKGFVFEFIKVKSHSGVKFNELADKLAEYAASSQN